MGMRLGRKLDPGDFITLSSFLGKEGKRKDICVVDKLIGMEDIEHVEDTVDIDGSRK